MKYGLTQEVYSIHYENVQANKKLPKFLKCDTSKKNDNIKQEIQKLRERREREKDIIILYKIVSLSC